MRIVTIIGCVLAFCLGLAGFIAGLKNGYGGAIPEDLNLAFYAVGIIGLFLAAILGYWASIGSQSE